MRCCESIQHCLAYLCSPCSSYQLAAVSPPLVTVLSTARVPSVPALTTSATATTAHKTHLAAQKVDKDLMPLVKEPLE